MIEIAAFAFAATASQSAQVNRKDNFVIVGKQVPAFTIKNFIDFRSQIESQNSSSTYLNNPVVMKGEDIFISPIKRSIIVKAKFVVGGKITQPPINDDEIVDFDE